MRKKTHEEFVKELLSKNKYFNNEDFELISNYENAITDILIKDMFGTIKMSPRELLKGVKPNIESAVDKNSYFLSKLQYISPCPDSIIELLSDYVNMHTKIIFRTDKGIFAMTPTSLLSKKCSNSKSLLNRQDYFLNLIWTKNEYYREGIITIEDCEILTVKQRLKIYTEFGCLESCVSNLIKNNIPSILSAVDKTEYFKNMLLKNNLSYREGGFTIESNYTNNITQILILKDGFYYKMTPASLLSGSQVTTQSIVDIDNYVKELGSKKHKGLYNYPLKINKGDDKLAVECKIHGIKMQYISHHLKGHGCQLCNSIGNTKESWVKSGKTDVGIFYVLMCYNETEKFYKIGITVEGVKIRYSGYKMPYKYKVILEFKSTNKGFLWDVENTLKSVLFPYKHYSQIYFAGCITEIFEYKPHILNKIFTILNEKLL